MKTMLLAVGLTGVIAFAQEKTVVVPGEKAETITSQTKDPQQSRNEQTTQILTNTPKGTAPANYKGASTVDEDLRQRVTVALSTGSVGTQGVLPSNLTTDIKVSVTNRVVTLRGDVSSEKSRETLGKRVAGLDGVKSVNNQLAVNPKGKPNRADLLKPDGYAPATTQRDDRGNAVKPTEKK